jgi:hypothetical protein
MEPATKLVASINPKERFNSVLFSDMGKLILKMDTNPEISRLKSEH